jgi:hypothetical protein
MSPDMQPKREFSEKYKPENCKEVEMISYLMDCYDRAGLEERLAPKVRCRFFSGAMSLQKHNFRPSRFDHKYNNFLLALTKLFLTL